MPFSAASSNKEKVWITVSPQREEPLGSGNFIDAPVEGALRLSVESGDGTFEQDPANPLRFAVVSGSNPPDGAPPSDTVYRVTADADMGPGQTDISDTVIYSVSSQPVPPPPAQATQFGFKAEAAEPKAGPSGSARSPRR